MPGARCSSARESGWRKFGCKERGIWLGAPSLGFGCVALGVMLWGRLKGALQWREMGERGKADTQQFGVNAVVEEDQWTGLSKEKCSGWQREKTEGGRSRRYATRAIYEVAKRGAEPQKDEFMKPEEGCRDLIHSFRQTVPKLPARSPLGGIWGR